MRISDWSSDVCSSDLENQHGIAVRGGDAGQLPVVADLDRSRLAAVPQRHAQVRAAIGPEPLQGAPRIASIGPAAEIRTQHGFGGEMPDGVRGRPVGTTAGDLRWKDRCNDPNPTEIGKSG